VKRYSRKRGIAITLGIMLLLSITAFAQEVRSEISVQGTGFFTKDTNNNGVQNQTTQSAGVLFGYRYNINRWLSAEANYGWTRNSQQYFGSFGTTAVRANVHQITGAGIIKLPTIARFQPYVMAGGGALIFDPTDAASNFQDATQQTRGAFLYGGGVDYNLTRHLGLRAEYRGFVYKQPCFNLTGLDSNTWTHTAQPSAGFVFKF
jgi:outer membrane immunogenic protein